MIIEILQNIIFYNYLKDNELIKLYNTCKDFRNNLDENMYYNLIKNKFSNNFVLNADEIINTWKECYYSIINFEKFNKINNLPIWNERDYLEYWKIIKQNHSKENRERINRDKIYREYYNKKKY